MQTVTGAYNWKLSLRREEDGIVILRAATCERKAALPEELFGLPVTALADHALCPTARPIEGEEVLVTRGIVGVDSIGIEGTDSHSLKEKGELASLVRCARRVSVLLLEL